MNQRSRSNQEQLRPMIRQQLNCNGPSSLRQLANMATLNQDEFHPEVMNVGSTGEYRDMKGGAHFEEYDCGHTYDDAVIRETFQKTDKVDKGKEILAFLKNEEDARKALIAGEILGTRGGMKRRRK